MHLLVMLMIYCCLITKLIEDEQEAIDGYHNAITEFKNRGKCSGVIIGLSQIYEEEVKHISYLKEIESRIKSQENDFAEVYGIIDEPINVPPYKIGE